MSEQSTLPTEGFINLKDVLKVIPVSRGTWYTGIKTGKFPAPVKIGDRISVWNVADIRQLIQKIDAGELQ